MLTRRDECRTLYDMLSIRLDSALEEELDRLAIRLGLTRSALVRKVLSEYCVERKRHKPKAMITFRLGAQHPGDDELYPDPTA